MKIIAIIFNNKFVSNCNMNVVEVALLNWFNLMIYCKKCVLKITNISFIWPTS